MKIAISSEGNSLDSEIDTRFGRCKYFIFVELDNNQIKNTEILENPAQQQMGGAGISASEFVANKEVSAIITGNMGPRAFNVLNQFKIDVFNHIGKVKEAIEKFTKGELTKIDSPTGPMHMGEKK